MRVRLSPLPQSMHEHGWSEGRGRAREGSEWSGSSRSGAPLSPASLPRHATSSSPTPHRCPAPSRQGRRQAAKPGRPNPPGPPPAKPAAPAAPAARPPSARRAAALNRRTPSRRRPWHRPAWCSTRARPAAERAGAGVSRRVGERRGRGGRVGCGSEHLRVAVGGVLCWQKEGGEERRGEARRGGQGRGEERRGEERSGARGRGERRGRQPHLARHALRQVDEHPPHVVPRLRRRLKVGHLVFSRVRLPLLCRHHAVLLQVALVRGKSDHHVRLPVELKVVHLLQAGGKGGGGEAQKSRWRRRRRLWRRRARRGAAEAWRAQLFAPSNDSNDVMSYTTIAASAPR